MDAFRYCAQHPEPFDFIFAGPPYALKGLDTIPDVIMANGILAEAGLLVLEHNPGHDFREHSWFVEQRNYGQTWFSFFSNS
jgi:16S rRNA G966 N2-methylase RsmD